MTKRAEVLRAFVRSLPESVEGEHGHREAYRVGRKLFVVFQPGDDDLLVNVDPDDRRALVAENPAAFEEIVQKNGTVLEWIVVHVAAAGVDEICEVLEDAWRRFAPKRALAARDAGTAT